MTAAPFATTICIAVYSLTFNITSVIAGGKLSCVCVCVCETFMKGC